MAKRQRTISDVVRDIISSLPETEEFVSHGQPTFRVRGKIFGVYTINHHGDGRVALNLVAPRGAQAILTKIKSSGYFVPSYVGHKGWIGVELDKEIGWQTIYEHVVDAYSEVAPRSLSENVDLDYRVKGPTRKFRPDEIDPFQSRRAKKVLKQLDAFCSALPEVIQAKQFGAPVWKAGKKTFVSARHFTGRLKLSIWVGAKRQQELIKDPRFEIAPYTGHNGWIDLDVHDQDDWGEIEELTMASYRHFALKRMLKALDE